MRKKNKVMKDKEDKSNWRYYYIGDKDWIVNNFYSFDPEDQMIEAIDNKQAEHISNSFVEEEKSSELDLHQIIESLPDRYGSLLWDYYFEGKTLEQIGEERGYTKQYAFQEHKKALELMKEKMK